jgi:methylmalonyl-CoA/ethylmalonyl-CoA epimerase
MTSMKFDHIGVVVSNIANGRRALRNTVAVKEWTREVRDFENGVAIQFGRCQSGVIYELLEPLGEDSPVHVALRERRALLNHLAYLVPDLAIAAATLRSQGCVATGAPRPAIAYGGKSIQFFLTPLYFLMELIEAPDHEHAFDWREFDGL